MRKRRSQRGPDIAGKVRAEMMLAIKRCEANGHALADMLEKELKKDPLAVLKAVAPWIPKEIMADVEVAADPDKLPETAAWLAECLGDSEEASSEDAVSDGSILPPPVRTQ